MNTMRCVKMEIEQRPRELLNRFAGCISSGYSQESVHSSFTFHLPNEVVSSISRPYFRVSRPQIAGALDQIQAAQPGKEANVHLAWKGVNEDVKSALRKS